MELLRTKLRHPAPSGYGKTVLASSVLESASLPHTWLSLDKQENDLRVFLEYILAVIESILPQALQRTQLILSASTMPPVQVIGGILINELVELDRETGPVDAIGEASVILDLDGAVKAAEAAVSRSDEAAVEGE